MSAEAFVRSLASVGGVAPGDTLHTAEPAWLSARRSDALASFTNEGLPTTRWEDWRFTPLSALASTSFSRAVAGAPSAAAIECAHRAAALLPDAHRLVFVNGALAPGLSAAGELPRGVRIDSLARVLASEPELVREALGALAEEKGHPFTALNTARFSDGALVVLERAAVLDRPVHLLFVEDPTGSDEPVASHPRTLVVARDRSQVRIVEQHASTGTGGGFVNPVSELHLGDDAIVDHIVLQGLAPASFLLGAITAAQARSSQLTSFSVAMGARLSRLEIHGALQAEGAHASLFGLYLARGGELADHHTTIDHTAPHTTSRELYKGILDDTGKGVFHGRIHVHPRAQKIDASQTNRTLLLSDRATIHTKPQLEIYADDVKCSHGATIGQLDPAQIFYLRSRGLSLDEARALLTTAFANEVTSGIAIEPLRDRVRELVHRWLPRGGDA